MKVLMKVLLEVLALSPSTAMSIFMIQYASLPSSELTSRFRAALSRPDPLQMQGFYVKVFFWKVFATLSSIAAPIRVLPT